MSFIKNKLAMVLGILLLCSCDNSAQNKSTKSKAMEATAKFTEGKDYNIFERIRVVDETGFAQPVEAYSILLPKGWQVQQKIDWHIDAMYPGKSGTFAKLKASSPDDAFVFEILSSYVFIWQNDPSMQQFNGPNTEYSGTLQPMDAEQYLRTQMLAQIGGRPSVTTIEQNPGAITKIQQDFSKTEAELRQYGGIPRLFPSAVTAGLKWTDGSEGKFICGVALTEMTVPNTYTGGYNVFYTGSVSPRILMRYPPGKKEEGEKIFSTMLGSILIREAWTSQVNNYWKQWRNQRDALHRQKIQFMDEQTREIGRNAIKQGQENLKRMDDNMRSWELQQQSQDRMHSKFVKTIREVETYRDETGRVELSAGYDHAWSRSDGSSYILSNNPNFNPASVFQDQHWKEMKPVD
ncbi:MAG: hypothetical protein QM791_21640 [Ferruginibacter sp.]